MYMCRLERMEEECGTPILRKENVVYLMTPEEKNIGAKKSRKFKILTTLMATTILGLIFFIGVKIGKHFCIIRNIQVEKCLYTPSSFNFQSQYLLDVVILHLTMFNLFIHFTIGPAVLNQEWQEKD